jgi:microcystin-dependent protein
MSEAFMGEIRIMSFNFPPRNWALCNGQFLPINQNQALFSLLGTQYGGNGQTTFALPDLRGRVPLHFGQSYGIGQTGGEASHTVSQSEMPQHAHFLMGTTGAADQTSPAGNSFARPASYVYKPPQQPIAMSPAAVTNVGGSQPHENRQPFTVLSYCICLIGIFPSRN